MKSRKEEKTPNLKSTQSKSTVDGILDKIFKLYSWYSDSGDLKFNRGKVSEKNSPKDYCSWDEVESLTRIVADKIRDSNKSYDTILGITNGGVIPARLMGRELDIDEIKFIPVRNRKVQKEDMPLLSKDKKYLIVDEIYDTGHTYAEVHDAVRTFDCDFAFLMRRFSDNNSEGEAFIAKVLNHNKWIVFPWERKIV